MGGFFLPQCVSYDDVTSHRFIFSGGYYGGLHKVEFVAGFKKAEKVAFAEN